MYCFINRDCPEHLSGVTRKRGDFLLTLVFEVGGDTLVKNKHKTDVAAWHLSVLYLTHKRNCQNVAYIVRKYKPPRSQFQKLVHSQNATIIHIIIYDLSILPMWSRKRQTVPQGLVQTNLLRVNNKIVSVPTEMPILSRIFFVS